MDRDLRSLVAWLFNFLNGLAVFLGAVLLFYLWIKMEDNYVHRHAVGISFAVVAILTGCNILRLLYFRRLGGESEDYIISRGGPGGGVRVAMEAIRSELKHTAEEIPEVSRCKVNLARQGVRRIRIQISYIACEGSNILELSERLRQVIRERFQDMVPLGEGVKQEVEIDFESFGGKAPRKTEEKGKEPPEEPPFTGPRYPVDGEL